MTWSDVAAAGTDPDLLARVAALVGSTSGRAAVAAALAPEPNLLTAGVHRVVEALPTPTAAQRAHADAVAARWQALGVSVALLGDPSWPARLGRLSAPPLLLAQRGGRADARPAVAIVGARRATSYGTGVAAWLADAVAEADVQVVSGGAVGIDAAAHGAAVDAGTTVVLGCGHDVPYPRPHARPDGLFDRVLAGGGRIVSELLPGAQPRPHLVRARNRIVAALADVVVIVEGGSRSGALLTAGEAADLGVPVLAVPGDVRAPGSAAPHRLLAEGAGPCTSPDDVLALLGRVARVDSRAGEAPALSVLPAPIAGVLADAWPRPLRIDEVAHRAHVGVATVLAAITRGRVAGTVVEATDGVRLARAPQT